MNRVVITQTINPVIPLVGIPLKGYESIFVAVKTLCKCFLKIDYRFTRCKAKDSQDLFIKVRGKDLNWYINKYINYILSELLDICLDGYPDIKCDCNIPDIVAFAIITTEVTFNLFNVKRIEYDDYLKSLAVLDKEFWSINPAYITSLRCAYVYQEVCILRDIHNSIRLGSVDIKLGYLGNIECSNDLCLEIAPPFDTPSISFILKYTSHIVSRIAQDLADKGFITKSTLKHLYLLYDIETRTVMETLNNGMSKLSITGVHSIKPITDISSIKFYNITINPVEG